MLIVSLGFRNYRYLCSKASKVMKYLNVAEKNDVAKTISSFLSKGSARRREGYSVYNKIYEFETEVRNQNAKMVMTSVSGHLLNYEFCSSYRNWKNCDPQQLFDAPMRKTCNPDCDKIKKTLEREVKSCHGLIIWTDCDREGENIGFEIIQVCKSIKPNIPVYRAVFSEITNASARRALANLKQPDNLQSQAVDVRQELDLRIGAAFTRFLTMRLQRLFPEHIAEKLISYGSCQTPTLGFVAQRYKEADEFVSETFWKLKVSHTIDDLTVDFNWSRVRLFDKETCEDYLILCVTDPIATVQNVETKPKSKWRPLPMDTVELEKLGSRKLRISAKEIMTIAERLYTRGLISYPRTETNSFSKEIDLRSLVEQHTPHPDWGNFASRVLEWGPNPRNGKKSDQAHPPIHPIKLITGLSGNEQRVYELVVRHFLACVSKDATGSETIVNITIAGEKFTATGLCIHERNYLDVYPYEKWNAKQIHNYVIGSTFEPTEISMQEGATTGPSLLTEADLIALMEKHGIGTDATHAEHIHTIKEREYIGEVDRGLLVPSTIGMGLFEGYNAMALPLAQPVLRAEFELDLKKICTGERNPNDVLKEQVIKYKEAYGIIMEKARILDEQLAKRFNQPIQEISHDEPPINRIEEVLPCPKCSTTSMSLKQKKDNTGYFISCLSFPECKNVVWLSEDLKSVTVTKRICNKCGPGYHILEIKFSQMAYLGLLNASGTTYSTCLACDVKFRETFNINVDNVKRVGTIVSDTPRNGNRTTSTNLPGTRNALTTRSVNNPPQNSRSNSNFRSGDLSTEQVFSTSTDNNPPPNFTWGTSTGEALTTRLDNNPLSNSRTNSYNSDFGFDDSFDDIFASSEWRFDENTNTNNNMNHNTWGSSFSNSNTNNRSENRNDFTSTSSRGNNVNDPTEHNFNQNTIHQDINGSLEAALRCTSCKQLAKSLVVKKDGPNKGRHFYVCSGSCNFFKWGDEVSQTDVGIVTNRTYINQSRSHNDHVGGSNSVLCSGCNQLANENTVRKNGPNKGRRFYICHNCSGFFQWAVENVQSNLETQGSSSSSQLSSWRPNTGSARVDQPSTSRGHNSRPTYTEGVKRRKCGLCRAEGHTRIKCPRKDSMAWTTQD